MTTRSHSLSSMARGPGSEGAQGTYTGYKAARTAVLKNAATMLSSHPSLRWQGTFTSSRLKFGSGGPSTARATRRCGS